VHAGSGPARTIQHIIDQSPLIAFYREIIDKVEDDYHVTKRTVGHTDPPMTAEIQRVRTEMRKFRWFERVNGRKGPSVRDHFLGGLGMLCQRSAWVTTDEDAEDVDNLDSGETYEITGDDIAL